MCLSYLSVLSPFLFSCKNVFSSGGVGGCVGELPHNLLINCLKNVSILSICTQSVFVQLQKCLFFRGGLQVGPTFLKNALLSLLFHSKMSFTRKNPDFFPRSLRLLVFNKLTYNFFQGARYKTSFF